MRERLASFVLMTRMHPVNLRSALANRLAEPLLGRYARTSLRSARAPLAEADLVIFEGSAALLLVERVRRMAPRARLVYRASDDLRRLGLHPLILEAEARALPVFDLVSVPSAQVAEVLARYGRVEVHPPGIDKAAFDRVTPSPYADGPAAVFAGVSPFFDYDSLATAGEVAPDVAFHVIGPDRRPAPANVTFHAEMPFETVVPYLQHATFGLLFFPAGRRALPGGNGNKVAQYSYCRLPIVAPAHLERRAGQRVRLRARGPGEPPQRPRSGLADGALADVCRRSPLGRRARGDPRRATLVTEQKSREPRPPAARPLVGASRRPAPRRRSRARGTATSPVLKTQVRHHSAKQ